MGPFLRVGMVEWNGTNRWEKGGKSEVVTRIRVGTGSCMAGTPSCLFYDVCKNVSESN